MIDEVMIGGMCEGITCYNLRVEVFSLLFRATYLGSKKNVLVDKPLTSVKDVTLHNVQSTYSSI